MFYNSSYRESFYKSSLDTAKKAEVKLFQVKAYLKKVKALQ
ncbi:MAG: hypothetical protein WAO91_06860 [Candidatus Nitrosotenuis sp.]